MGNEVLRDIAEVIGRLEDLEDPRVGYAMIHERVVECQKAGVDVPEELMRLERSLLADCCAESQGR